MTETAQAPAAATTTGAAVVVRDLVKRYRKRPVNAVDGVSFEVVPGEIFRLLALDAPDALTSTLPGSAMLEITVHDEDRPDDLVDRSTGSAVSNASNGSRPDAEPGHLAPRRPAPRSGTTTRSARRGRTRRRDHAARGRAALPHRTGRAAHRTGE